MADHVQLIERGRVRALHARSARQHRAQQQRAAAQQKAKKKQKSVKAASILSIGTSPLTALESHASQVDLPENVLELVMSHLAHALEPGGVVGPSIVARNLANAALVCSEFYLASRHGFATLNRLIQTSLNQRLHKQPLPQAPSEFLSAATRQQHAEAVILAQGKDLPGPGRDWQFWDHVVAYPMTVTIPELWKAAGCLGVPLPLPQNHQQQQLWQQQQGQQAAGAAVPGNAPQPAAQQQQQEEQQQPQQPQQQKQQDFVPEITKKQHQRLVANVLAAFGLDRPRPALAAAAGGSHDPSSSQQQQSDTSSSAAAKGLASGVPGTAASAGASAAVLRAVVLERACPAVAWDGPDQCQALRATVSVLTTLRSRVVLKAQHFNGTRACLAKMRQELVAAGVKDLPQLQALMASEQQKSEQARQQQEQWQQQREEEEERRQRQQQEAKASAVKKVKGFSLGSVVIKPRRVERHDIIT